MTPERVMLLIDADNVSVDVMEQAVRLLMNQHGAVHVRRAYCTAESAVKHQAVFKRLSIKPMVNLAAGKNSTDIALAVDAIDLVLAERPDVVVIASSDSDFAPLVARLREKGCVVRGIGQEGKTGDETQDAYDDYTVLAHRKLAGAASASVAATGPARRGGGRAAGGGRGTAASKKTQAAAKPAGGAAPAQPASGEAARAQSAGRGQRGRRGEGPPQRDSKAAPERMTLTADDQAEDDAAAEATLAALRAATDRAASQQAAAAAAIATAASQPAAAEARSQDTQPPPEPHDPTGERADVPAPAAKKARKPVARKKTAAKAGSAEAAVADAETAGTTETPPPKAPARKTPARKTPSRKAAAGRSAVVTADPPAQPSRAPAGPHAADQAVAVADAEALAAQIAATLAPPAPAPAPAPRPAPPRSAAPQRTASVSPSSAAVAALPDKVLEILASLPELARGDTVELRLASQRMRDAGLLGRSASSTKLLGQFADRFELLPPGQPNHVRLRGGKLV